MCGHHRLSSLQVSEAGQHDIGIDFASVDECALKLEQHLIDGVQRVPYVKLEICCDLIISTASRMQFATDVTDPRNQGGFDVHVNVFKFRLPGHFTARDFTANDIQRLNNLLAFVGCQQSDFGEHPGVCLRSPNIDSGKAAVERNGFREFFDTRVSLFVERTSPRFHSHATLLRISV